MDMPKAEKVMWLVGTQEGAARYPKETYMAVTDGKKRFTLVELQNSYHLKIQKLGSFDSLNSCPLGDVQRTREERIFRLSKEVSFCIFKW